MTKTWLAQKKGTVQLQNVQIKREENVSPPLGILDRNKEVRTMREGDKKKAAKRQWSNALEAGGWVAWRRCSKNARVWRSTISRQPNGPPITVVGQLLHQGKRCGVGVNNLDRQNEKRGQLTRVLIVFWSGRGESLGALTKKTRKRNGKRMGTRAMIDMKKSDRHPF